MSDSEFTVCALMEHYQLGEEVCSQQVTDRHLNEIASSYCRHWKSLRAELGLKAIVEHDIDHSLSDDEEGKRRALFNKWKLMKGFSATYKALISALLEIKCRDDAEGVCEVLKQSIGAREQELCHDTQDSCQTDERVGTGCSPKVDESAKVDTTIQQKMSDLSLATDDCTEASCSVAPPLDPEIREDLVHILRLNRKRIITQYAHYVSSVCDCVVNRGVSVQRLCTFLLELPAFASDEDENQGRLLSGVQEKLEKADTIYNVFNLLRKECASFLNYDIYESIQNKFCTEVECEDFKYPERLKAYIEQHSIKEFLDVNPQLEKFTKASKKLTLKIDIEVTSKVAKVVNLKSSVAALLGLRPTALRLLGIEEGCVIVTFLIPAFVADAIFGAGKIVSTKLKEELRNLPVLWMNCGNFNLTCEDPSLSEPNAAVHHDTNLDQEKHWMELIEKRLSAQDQALQQSTKTQLPPQSVRHNSSPQPKSGGIGLGGGGEGKLLGRPKRIFMHHQHRTSFMTFGQHLKDCPVSPDKVPVVMEFCVEMVEKHGLTVEGIYRKPGCVATINSLSAQIDRGNYAFDGQDIHVVASLMKKFLKELPDALLPYHMYQDLVACARLRDEETKLSTLKDLVYHLPTAHYHTLKFLMCHLGKVVAHSQQNKMTLQNMALVFGHILMRGSIFDDLLANMTAVYTIMELLCKRCEYLCSTDLCAEEVEKFFVEQEDIPSQYALSFESDSLLLSLLGCREMATGDTGSLTDLSDMKLSSECGKSELGILKDQPKSHFYRYPEVPEPHNNLCQWEDCSVQCSHLEELVDHVNHVHVYRDSKEFICKWVGCPRKRDPFRRQHKLLVHLRRHTGERPHKCSYKGCSKAYTRLTNLKAHLLTHAGERYVCKYAGCDKAFPSISACANHMSREHSDEKPYACLHPGCTERYSDAGMRWSHMQQCPLNKKVINVAVVEQKDKASSDISTNEACASSAPTRSSVSAITVSRPKNTWKPSLTFDPSLTNRSLSGDIGYYTGGSNITGDSQGYASSHYSGKGFSSERSVAAVPPHIQHQMSMRQAGVEMEFQDWDQTDL